VDGCEEASDQDHYHRREGGRRMKMKKGEMLGKMIALAVERHAGQFDQSGRPYILHPLRVMDILDSDDEELQVIAVGHDIIEDTNTTYQELKDLGFTVRVVEAIRALTKVPGQTYEEYQTGVFANRDAMLVKAADLTHNSDLKRLKGIRDKDIERTVRYMKFYHEIQVRLKDFPEMTPPKRGYAPEGAADESE
jgi:(p)ppGpp synthase/HD superfamily hydrolase